MKACNRCQRPLSDPISVLAGMGPVCRAKTSAASTGEEQEQPVLAGVQSLAEFGLICRRLDDGRLACNVPQLVVWHSPAGFECGYSGSGPADLALNVLHLLIPKARAEEGVKCFSGERPSARAVRLHQDFKAHFIARMDRKGGEIPISDIREWIEARLVALTAPEQAS
jgi:hypothetical protein